MANNSRVYRLLCQFRNMDENIIAFSLYDGECVRDITYGQFLEDILAMAGFFFARNVYRKHIALIDFNNYNWLVAFFAIISSGNVAVPMNPLLPVEILQQQIERADVDLVCGNQSTLDELNLGDIDADVISFDALKLDGKVVLDNLCYLEDEELALMLYTSGTTGSSKIAMLSAENLFFSVDNFFCEKRAMRPCHLEREMIVSPFYHIASLRFVLYRLINGEILCIGRGPQYLLLDMPKLNPSCACIVPAISESISKVLRRVPVKQRENYIGKKFCTIFSAGATLRPTLANYFREQKINVESLYGMTETFGHGTWCVLDERHQSSIGKPDGNISFRLENGEILLKSKAVMMGYYKDPEETSKIITDGWLHTGDMGYCDQDGYYYITGRKKNVIILSNGENVNPEEIEEIFNRCEYIIECLVYSDGKGICADVYANNHDIAAAYIKSYNESMPMFRQVYKVNYMDEPLPKTGSGKIKRKENI